MAIEGSLRDLAFQDVLQLLELARKTGVLTVMTERGDDDAEVHFDAGEIVFARRRNSQRRLGQQLIRSGKLTERELQRALELQRANPSQRLAWILLEMGSVSREELERHLRFQIEEAVYEVMSWTDGHFRFEERESVPTGDPEVRMRVDSLLMEGARRIDEWARLESRIPSEESVPVLAASEDAPGAPPSYPEEWEVLAEIDGEQDLRQIAAALGAQQLRRGADRLRPTVSMGVVGWRRARRLTDQELDGDCKYGSSTLARRRLPAGRGRAQSSFRIGRSWRSRGRRPTRRARPGGDGGVRAPSVWTRPAGHLRLGFTAVRISDFGVRARSGIIPSSCAAERSEECSPRCRRSDAFAYSRE